jgi:hypothetical protein
MNRRPTRIQIPWLAITVGVVIASAIGAFMWWSFQFVENMTR